MSKVTNTGFFQNSAPAKPATANKPQQAPQIRSLQIRKPLRKLLDQLNRQLLEMGQKEASAQLKTICKRSERNRFAVAVVGEFSRGKSTFINELLGKSILPIGDMPTTALLTRIRYNNKNRMVHIGTDGKKQELPLGQESWEGLTAENLGKEDPTGTVMIGLSDPWLGQNGIELMDTPGAGDLDAARAQRIGDALLSCDGAIITISATAALSMSELLFIRQRLLTRKTPYLMLILTKLDQVPKAERADVIRYVKEKLQAENISVPVFVPYSVEMDTDEFLPITGMDAVRAQILSWVTAPERLELTERWIATQALAVLEQAESVVQDRQLLLQADEEKRKELIQEKKNHLKKAEVTWEELRLQMLKRCNACYDQVIEKANDYAQTITERLQYESSHAAEPQKWWENDYGYRLKVELANMATGIESTASRILQEDIRWFNGELERCFKTHILSQKETIYDKKLISESVQTKRLEFENLNKKKATARIGTAALSIAGYAVCASFGFLPLIATMGIGTGSAILTEGFFKKKVEEQRKLLGRTIATEVPRVISLATAESEQRLKSVYNDVILSAKETETAWMAAQEKLIEESLQAKQPQDTALQNETEALEALKQKLLAV